MIDYHMHLEKGPFTLEWLKQFWEHAQRRGISEIGITEHAHRFRECWPIYQHLTEGSDAYSFMKDWLSRDFQHNIETYLELLTAARTEGIPVKIGIEMDYFPESEAEIHQLTNRYDFDYILGSVHVIGKWGFDYSPQHGWDGRDIDQAYRDYFSLVGKAANSGLFDILAHLDVIKVFGKLATEPMTQELTALLTIIKENNLCIEVSSAGLRKPVGEIYPSEQILSMANTCGIPITFASDAHEPASVGANWEDLVTFARRCGYSDYRVFNNRRSSVVVL